MAIAKGSCIVQVIVAPNRDVLRRSEIAEHNHRFGLAITINVWNTPETQPSTSLYCTPYCDSSSADFRRFSVIVALPCSWCCHAAHADCLKNGKKASTPEDAHVSCRPCLPPRGISVLGCYAPWTEPRPRSPRHCLSVRT